MAESAGCAAVLAIIQNRIDYHRNYIGGHYLSKADRERHWAAMASLVDIASRITEPRRVFCPASSSYSCYEEERGREACSVLQCARYKPDARTPHYRLLVYGWDDKLVLAIPLSDDQATALGAALHLGMDLMGEYSLPHVHFEVCG